MSPFRKVEVTDEVTELRRKVSGLHARVEELASDNHALRAQLEGNIPSATAWLQMKVDRQRKVLDAGNRTVIGQRFVLRTLESLGRGLTRDEYLAARAAEPNGQLRERIPEKPITV
jgi:hypothetical protein